MTAGQASDLLQLTYRPDLDLLVGRWSYQPDPALLPAAYELLTARALESGCSYWLQDIRRRAANDPAITRWLLAEYFPDMARRLNGRLRVAYLTGPALLEQIVAAPDFVPAKDYAGKAHAVAFFGDEGAAVAWLQEQRG
ncbi:hypothetical protein [Hymenobacter rubripertinctus]|uniref:STAS/SEC14 domain-containing protein n=1 Tax=Hymenobacter rubripertinctus TaxID=2029981 RepID=A0A418R2G1_9BACT|nr:hypothetical protein [Hymenobacter rubripertinctus]RIY11578.1 hypothetical protein D0T11_07150 [Hymenobacter rubripertinctus]